VGRQFRAEGPNRLWVADLVYVPTEEGVLYLSVVLDVWSRRVVRWAMRPDARAELVEMALWRRRPAPGLVHHSDRGSQYSSLRFGARLRAARILPSMGRKGDAYDNALCEAFFATLTGRCSAGVVSAPARRLALCSPPTWRFSNRRRRRSTLSPECTSGLQTVTSRAMIRSAETKPTYRGKAVRFTGRPVLCTSRCHTVATWLVRKPSRLSSRYRSKSPNLADSRTGSATEGRALCTNSVQVARNRPYPTSNPAPSAMRTYFRTVLRSIPRLRAIWRIPRPASQCVSTSAISRTLNSLRAIPMRPRNASGHRDDSFRRAIPQGGMGELLRAGVGELLAFLGLRRVNFLVGYTLQSHEPGV